MYDVIQRKVKSFEKRLEDECRRVDNDKLLHCPLLDYIDCIRLSKERLLILLSRDLKRHQDCFDDLNMRTKAWEAELQRSLSKYRSGMNYNSIPEVRSSINGE